MMVCLPCRRKREGDKQETREEGRGGEARRDVIHFCLLTLK